MDRGIDQKSSLGKLSCPSVLVSIVTYNSANDIGPCLDSLCRQDYRAMKIVIWDNASRDDTRQKLEIFQKQDFEVIYSEENTGFSVGHNGVLARHDSDYVLFLNPDTQLPADFISRAVREMEDNPGCGSLSPKIMRLDDKSVLDSTGIVWTKNQRHLDRGSGKQDRGQYDQRQLVFGVTGAMAFYRRKCLDDVAFKGEVFDEDFYLYREDADLAWRCNWRGWKCLYSPEVVGFHKRTVLPSNRRETSHVAKRHSVKNRFLLRIKNMPARTWLRFFLPITLRDKLVIGYVLFFEWKSLPALRDVFRLYPKMLAKRRHIMSRARASRREMEGWFYEDSRPLQLFSFDETVIFKPRRS